jgi:S-adenosyl methyltransferase
MNDIPAHPGPPPGLDISMAHMARVYDYWLGGKDNFPADRRAAKSAMRDFPGIIAGVREQRAFLARAVRYLAGPAGIRQFLDIGTGLPSADNTHEVAQAVAPQSRVVYVDNDPLVLVHAQALLASGPHGVTAYLDADLRDTGAILQKAAGTLDFSQPVAIFLIGILHLILDEDEPHALVRQLVNAVPAGSWLVIAHPASDVVEEAVTMVRHLQARTPMRAKLRDRAEIARFFEGLELLPPGLVQLHRWYPDGGEPQSAGEIPEWCGAGRKPLLAGRQGHAKPSRSAAQHLGDEHEMGRKHQQSYDENVQLSGVRTKFCRIFAGSDGADASVAWSGGADAVLLEQAAEPEKLAMGGGKLFLELADRGPPRVAFLAEPGSEDVDDVAAVRVFRCGIRGRAAVLLGAQLLDSLAQSVVAVEEVEADPGGPRDRPEVDLLLVLDELADSGLGTGDGGLPLGLGCAAQRLGAALACGRGRAGHGVAGLLLMVTGTGLPSW